MNAPTWLAPAFRYAGDDWSEANALLYTVYAVAPTFDADGNPVSSGTPQNLTGFTVSGKLLYGGWGFGPNDAQGMPSLPVPTGTLVDPANGLISLSLPSASTGFRRQQFKAWENPAYSLLIAQPMITSPDGAPLVTVGLQPLFVF